MTPEQYGEVAKSLGVAAPLVIVLLYLLKVLLQLLNGATEERKAITAQFVEAMKTTVATSALAQQQAATALQDLAASQREQANRTTDEHNRLIDAIGKFQIGRRDT